MTLQMIKKYPFFKPDMFFQRISKLSEQVFIVSCFTYCFYQAVNFFMFRFSL